MNEYWRKQGGVDWTPSYASLQVDDDHELQLIEGSNRKWTCTSCGTELRGMYVLYGSVPRRVGTDKRYCIEHSPVAVEVSEI